MTLKSESKIYSLYLRLVLSHILYSQDVLSFGICFLLYFFKLSAGHGFFFFIFVSLLGAEPAACFSIS